MTNTESTSSEFEDWIERKYTQFTIIGVFGGLSVYLSQVPGKITEPVQAGIAGSLIIFLILTILLVFDGIKEALKRINDPDIHIFSFIFVSVGLIGIVMAVVSVLSRYSKGASPLIDAGMTVSISLFYIGQVFLQDLFSGVKPENLFRQVMTRSHHIALIWLVSSFVYQFIRGEPTVLDIATSDIYVIQVLLVILTHLALTLLVLLSLIAGEIVTHKLPNTASIVRKELWKR